MSLTVTTAGDLALARILALERQVVLLERQRTRRLERAARRVVRDYWHHGKSLLPAIRELEYLLEEDE